VSFGCPAIKQDPGEQARLARADAGVAFGGIAGELRLNRIPQRLIDQEPAGFRAMPFEAAASAVN
jgi:hypothetical protein